MEPDPRGEDEIVQPSWTRTARSLVITTVVVAGTYYLGARLGLRVALVEGQVTPVWPPTGIAIAALLLVGWRAIPGIALGALAVNLPLGSTGPAVAAIVAGNTLAPVGTIAMLRVARFRLDFARARDVLVFIGAALAGMIISASIGALVLFAAGAIPGTTFWTTWSVWWAGDATGAIVLGPAILLIAARIRTRDGMPMLRILELFALLTVIGTGTAFLFNNEFPTRFAIFPLLVWVAWRFEQTGASLGALVAASAAAYATSLPTLTTRGGIFERMIVFQGFTATATLTALMLAALIADRRVAHALVAAAGLDLEARITARTADLMRALRELEHSENRLSEAQQVAHIGSWEWDIDRDVITWTDELYRIYGVPLGTPSTYDTYIQRVHPDDRDMVDSAVQGAFGDHRPFAFDHRIRRDDGSVSWVQGRGRVVTDAGRPVRMLGTAQDIDDRKRVESIAQEVHDARSRRRQALELNDEVVQGLSVAAYAFHAGRVEQAREAVEATLSAARALVGELMGEVGDNSSIKPGDLQRAGAADVFRRTG